MPQHSMYSWPDPARLGSTPWRRTLVLLGLGAAAAAPYGAVMGSWHGGRLALYAAVKLPLMLWGTWVLVLPFGCALSKTLGWTGSLGSLAEASAHTIFATSAGLLALTPVNLLFTRSIPPPDPGAVWDYRLLYLGHLGVVAGMGVVASIPLARCLRPGTRASVVAWLGWVAVFAFVAGEVSWALRPFIGNPYSPVTFLRADAIDGNAYEMVVRDLLPALVPRWPR